MKKQFRILAAALALCLSLLCCPAAFAAVDSSSCQTVPYAQATSQPLGQPITITGTPNYSAATSNDTAFIFGFDTADGVWYVAVQKSKFDAFKAAAPAQQMTLYGVYAGILDVNGMPILDIQNGSVLLNGTTSDTTALYTAGQEKAGCPEGRGCRQQQKDHDHFRQQEHCQQQKEHGQCIFRPDDQPDGVDPHPWRQEVPQQPQLQRNERP